MLQMEEGQTMARMCFIRRSRGVVFLSSFVTCHRSLKLTRRTMLVERGMFVLSERQDYTPDYIGGRGLRIGPIRRNGAAPGVIHTGRFFVLIPLKWLEKLTGVKDKYI
jgi:hypothetical protein